MFFGENEPLRAIETLEMKCGSRMQGWLGWLGRSGVLSADPNHETFNQYFNDMRTYIVRFRCETSPNSFQNVTHFFR